MNEIVRRIHQKAALLKIALDTNHDASKKRHQALTAWNAEDVHTEATSLGLTHAEGLYDTTRDAVIAKASHLLDTVHILLRLTPPRGYEALAQHAASMQERLDEETVAFIAHSKTSHLGPLSLPQRDRWIEAKDRCAQAALSLMMCARSTPLLPDDTATKISQAPTDLEGTPPPAWSLLSTVEEQTDMLSRHRAPLALPRTQSPDRGSLRYTLPKPPNTSSD